MNKPLIVSVVLLMLLSLCSCASENVTIDYGESKLYSNDDMDAAIQVIRETFDTFDGCKLYSLSYAGDETCEESLPYCQSLSEEQEITQCIVFGSSFRSPRNGGGAWTANAEYTWTWYLAKGAAGDWVLLTYGYA